MIPKSDVNLHASDDLGAIGESRTQAPVEVRWALKLLWLALAFSVVQYLFFLPVAISALPTNPGARGPGIFSLALPLGGYMFGAYLNIKIARRKNWARIIKFIIAAASLCLQWAFSPGLTGIEYLTAGAPPALSFAALYLLFLTSGRQWFRRESLHPEI
jgi:hypothetical protein